MQEGRQMLRVAVERVALLFGRTYIQIFTWRMAVLIEVVYGSLQFLHENNRILPQIMSLS
jgi:hypothetical protein